MPRTATSVLCGGDASRDDSQHNNTDMSAGDDFIGSTVAALQASPEWSSTAIFIEYDDCGCFYDHVNPCATTPNGASGSRSSS